jgi:N-acetylmuramoyl-L-alanine amidase
MMFMCPGDLDIMARTMWGENRNSVQGMFAVGWVIKNRCQTLYRRQTTVAGVCLDPKQFSAWNEHDPNRVAMQDVGLQDWAFRTAIMQALKVVGGTVDPTHGSRHYHAEGVSPRWAKGKVPVYSVGGHFFYNDVK